MHSKLITLATALAFTLTPGVASAGTVIVTDPGRSNGTPNMLLVNPGDLLNGVVSIEYERAVARFFGLTVGFSAAAFDGPFNFGQPSYVVLGPELGFRFHVIRDAPGGLWFGPYANAGYVIARETGAVYRAFSWGLGAAFGYNFIIGRHFTFQLGAGGGFNDYGDALVWAPRLKLGVGAVF